ncbi:hypothetical protein HOH45_08935 [bacterium]|jgi:bile acid:Na+ symporter, BASS family|nr:hypothetical protein [bacterium]
MFLLKQMDRFFWAFISLGVIFGFLFPSFMGQFEPYVLYIVMGIIGVLFLKVDIVSVVSHVKKPLFLLYVLAFNLLVIPLICFFTYFQFFEENLAMALLLLSALPAGVSSAAFTDIMKGKTSLGLTIVIFTNLLAPLTIPLLFWMVFTTTIELDYLSLIKDMSIIMIVPFLVAKCLKHVILKPIIHKITDYYDVMILSLLAMMMMITIGSQAEFVMQNISSQLKTIGILFSAFFLFQVLGYVSVFWVNKGEKVAVSNSKMIMNNILGIVLGLAFFPPEVSHIIILSLIPWGTMIIVKHWYKKYLP